jgi:hypothetical protein
MKKTPTTTFQNAMYNFFVSRLFEEMGSLLPWADTETNEFQTQNRARCLALLELKVDKDANLVAKGTRIWALLGVPKMVGVLV